jgi:hypothetical protein
VVVAFSYAGFSQYIALRAPSPGIKIFLRRVPSRTPSASQGDQVRVGVAIYCYTRINSINSWRRQIRVEILNGACPPNDYKTASARSESEYEQLEKGLIGESIVAVASDFETSTGFVLLFDGRIECEKHLAIVFLSYPIDGLAFVPNSSSCYSMRSGSNSRMGRVPLI